MLLAGEEGVLVDEAKSVSPRVLNVKRALTPGTLDELTGALAMYVFSRKTLQLLRSLVDCFSVAHSEIDVIGQWLWLEARNAFAVNVDQRQNHRPTINVMTRGARNSPAAVAEQLSIKLFSLVEIVDLENDPVECGRHSGSFRYDLLQINAGHKKAQKAQTMNEEVETESSAQILVKRFKKALFACLDETFSNVRGIYLDKGTTLYETLAGVSAEEASQAISPKSATIAAQVEHIRFYLDVLDDYMRTGVDKTNNWREIWETVRAVTPDEWEDMKRCLRESHERVMATINLFENWDGKYDIAGALSILVHTAYHLGGIRQALGAIRAGTHA